MKNVRFGIIGLGNMGGVHARAILEGKIPGAVLGAVCDMNPAALAAFPGILSFSESDAMIASGAVDAVLIGTPHFSHTPIGIAALKAGLHVLVEKPISVHKADCEKLIAAYKASKLKHRKQVFAAMFNQRTDPFYLKLRELIRSGELGSVRRIQWTVTNWFRSQAYYNSGGWRATWAGEGGGVLLNQCPHNLDLWQWLFGMPEKVRAFAALGRYHDIEVEDDVTAYLSYRDGATGVFITSTGEAPGTNRLEVAAERGRVVIENGRFSYTRNEVPMSEFSRTTPHGFERPPVWEATIPISGNGEQHNGILKNFVESILDGKTLIAPAVEGIHSVELANAMLLSSSEEATVALPLSGARYAALLEKRIAASKKSAKAKPKPKLAKTAGDFSKSFNS
ncbi:Predicted dehydrogenase [Verrucomicrobium sp. GAS474]|uniref:Gfo/Idh/MocA family protein n=1 Tax=Verrucomicrobium sp. GAS474 TaxID=1882831 RepID=UPI00087C6C64|nr:Gfo/Idh/MocA family oxidoreductase [Verrucomicrobium sp. GAS474]SDU30593.1 Predicted dehydrogenase [Verrucomicrobium sp. GAS474]